MEQLMVRMAVQAVEVHSLDLQVVRLLLVKVQQAVLQRAHLALFTEQAAVAVQPLQEVMETLEP
jgi:hypothetical protein